MKQFNAGATISKVKVQVSERLNGYTDAFYYIETLSSKVLYRIHANGVSNQFIIDTISFADNVVKTNIVGIGAISYLEGALLVGNYNSFKDKFGAVYSTLTSGIFVAGIQGINSNHNYSTYDTKPPD